MDNNKHREFDQIFRERLHDMEVAPPASVWEGIQASGANTSAAKSSNWRWWAAASLLGLLLSSAAYLYFDGETTEQVTPPKQQTIQDHSPEQNQSIQQETVDSPAEEASEIMETINEQAVIESIEKELPIEEQINQQESISEEALAQEIESEDIIKNNTAPEDQIIRAELVDELESQKMEEGIATEETTADLNNDLVSVQPQKAGYDFFDDDAIEEMTSGHNEFKRWELGIEFSPEWITIPDNDNNIRSYGLDLSARYHFSKWFVETGIGAAISKDDGIYGVDYQEMQFKGSYQDVYNVTFDTTGGTPIPTYYTKLVNVYDTIDRYTVTENKNTYAYINIPINIGYNTSLGEKFSFYAKTGVIGSFKIYENIPTPTVDGTIVAYYPLYHQRTDWHLQAQLNVGINYHITEKFLFGVEPNARYYVKSLVETNNGGNPYGFGVKIGFKYVIKK